MSKDIQTETIKNLTGRANIAKINVNKINFTRFKSTQAYDPANEKETFEGVLKQLETEKIKSTRVELICKLKRQIRLFCRPENADAKEIRKRLPLILTNEKIDEYIEKTYPKIYKEFKND